MTKSTQSSITTLSTLSAISLLLGGCPDVGGERDTDGDGDRISAWAAAQNVHALIGFFTTGVSLADFFGPQQPLVVDLSEEALEEIEDIVEDTTVTLAYEQYTAQKDSLVDNIRTLAPTFCDVDEPGCRTEMSNDSQTLTLYASQVNDLWEAFTSSGELLSIHRLKHTPQSVLLGSLRTKILQEKFLLDRHRNVDVMDSWEDMCEAAEDHAKTLEGIEDTDYAEWTRGHFSQIYFKIIGNKALNFFPPVRFEVTYVGCFQGPDAQGDNREWCDGNEQKRTCSAQWCKSENVYINGEKIWSWAGSGDYSGAASMRSEQTQRFAGQKKEAILGGEFFDDLIDELKNMEMCGDAPPPLPCKTLHLSESHYPTKTTGEYELVGEYEGSPLYERHCGFGNGPTCSLYRRANGHWYLDYDGADEAWSGTLDYTASPSSRPEDVDWNKAVVSCIDDDI